MLCKLLRVAGGNAGRKYFFSKTKNVKMPDGNLFSSSTCKCFATEIFLYLLARDKTFNFELSRIAEFVYCINFALISVIIYFGHLQSN